MADAARYSASAGLPVAADRAAPDWMLRLGTLNYLLALALLALLLPAEVFSPDSRTFILAVGAIAAWRWGWGALHLARALWFRLIQFPELREAADALPPARAVPRLYCIVTSYRASTRTTVACFEALVGELGGLGAPATLVAVLTDPAEEALVEDICRRGAGAQVELVLMRQDGSGKRSALAQGLRAVTRRVPPPDAVVVLMDGDTLMPPGGLRRMLPFFRLMPRLGGLTVDTRPVTAQGGWVRAWFNLRFAQRHLLMCSMALSRRLLVLTGRLSAYRAATVCEPEFIEVMERDGVDHWRYGRVPFLTGDDKSAWFHLLKKRWDMLYLPDVQARTIEDLPSRRFIGGSLALMRRWFGNMLRNNGRALRLGPRGVGSFFAWWCLLDQRLSMWTALTGPAFALLMTAVLSPAFLLVYALWVMATRLVLAVVLCAFRGQRFRPHYPLLLFYNQIGGALIKVYMAFRLDRQAWTRQKVALAEHAPMARAWHGFWNGCLHASALSAFLYALALATGTLPPPGPLLLSAAGIGGWGG